MTTRGKVLIAIIVLAGLYFGITKLTSSNLLFKKATTESVLLNSIELPETTGGKGVSIGLQNVQLLDNDDVIPRGGSGARPAAATPPDFSCRARRCGNLGEAPYTARTCVRTPT